MGKFTMFLPIDPSNWYKWGLDLLCEQASVIRYHRFHLRLRRGRLWR